jgi:heme-degrading monooxygenase HmoA
VTGGEPSRYEAGQIITVFRSRLEVADDTEYCSEAETMESAARQAVGFVAFKSFVADDGERVSVATFASEEAQRAWRDDVRHREAQRRGRAEFYSRYSIQVGVCTHAVEWARPDE